jgi:ankyrin repeat protein
MKTDVPSDIWLKMFDEGDVKEKIRILNTSKSIRDHIYTMYGGKKVVDDMIQREKDLFELAKIDTIMNSFEPLSASDLKYIINRIKYFDDVNDIRDREGRTILMKACIANNDDVVRMLLKVPGINLDEQDKGGRTALMYACYGYFKEGFQYSGFKIVKLLLTAGANMNVTDREGENAIMYAEESENFTDIAVLFINAGANNAIKREIRRIARDRN